MVLSLRFAAKGRKKKLEKMSPYRVEVRAIGMARSMVEVSPMPPSIVIRPTTEPMIPKDGKNSAMDRRTRSESSRRNLKKYISVLRMSRICSGL